MRKLDPARRSMPEINTDKVCFVVEKARTLLSQDEGAPSSASYAPLRRGLVEFIDDLDCDEAAALVALAWIGRGDFEPEDWRSAVALAVERCDHAPSAYLLGMPLLPDYLEDALSAYDCSCRDFGPCA